MAWGLTVGVEGGLGRGGQRGTNCDNSNRITIKKFKQDKERLGYKMKKDHSQPFKYKYRSMTYLYIY